MPITTADFTSLTDDLQEVWNEAAKNAIADSKGFKIFEVKETNRRTYDFLVLHGIDVIQSVAQGGDLPVASSDQGDSATWTQSRYGGIVAVTKDMRMFDLYDEIQSLISNATQDAFDKIDQSLADVLLYGWNTTYTDVYGDTTAATAVDGLQLFTTVHTNGLSTAAQTYARNQIRLKAESQENPELARQAIVDARVDARTQKDPNKLIRPYNLDRLVVAPSKGDLAERILFSSGVQGTPNVDSNPLNGKVQIIEWERLESDSAGTDKSAYWFMYDSKKVGGALKCLFAERPSLDAPEQVYKNKNWEYSIDFYYAIGRGYPLAAWGSNGTKA